MFRILVPAALLTASAFAQAPVFEASKVQILNSNDTTPLGPGELISVYGSNLGPDQPCQGQADPDARETPNPRLPDQVWDFLLVYPKELCGVRVLVGGERAGLLYVHRDQINFKVPQSVPMEGTVGLQIVHGDQSSAAVQIEAGLAPIRLTPPKQAFTEMPIWLSVDVPPRRGYEVRYPYGVGPGYLGCDDLQLRIGGRQLEKNPASAARNGIGSGPECGSMAQDDRYSGRLPLHLLYRIDQPGDYEVRLVRTSNRYMRGARREEGLLVLTEWTPLRVGSSSKQQRSDWLAGLTANPPVAPGELLGDYLPNVVGIPGEQSLFALMEQLYHPNPTVARYAELALTYWTQSDVLSAAPRALENKGPSTALVSWLLNQSQKGLDPLSIVEACLNHLDASDPVVLRGAVRAVYSLGWLDAVQKRPELRARASSAMIQAEKYVLASGDYQTSQEYVQSLGMLGDERAVPILWRFVDEGIALGPSLGAIAQIARPEDLSKLAAFIGVKHMPRDYYYQTDGLLGALMSAYGADALPYVERVIQETDIASLRDGAGNALVYADLPEAWAFIAKAIENDAAYKADLMRYIGARYPDANATQASMLALAKRLATGLEP